jgi:hypothetical protein
VSNLVSLRARRWFWRKFNPLVRFGWIVANNASGSGATGIGLGLITVGLAIGKPKRVKLYSTSLPVGQEIRIRVVRNGRTIASG